MRYEHLPFLLYFRWLASCLTTVKVGCDVGLWLFVGLLVGVLKVEAQPEITPAAFTLQAELNVGRVFKHTPRFMPEIRTNTTITALTLEQPMCGSTAWQRDFGYPVVGLTLSYADFGEPQIFGNAIALCPNITFTDRHRQRRFYSWFRHGIGLAYLTRHYDPATNPTNNVIGSPFNCIVDIRGGAGVVLSPQLELTAGLAFTHYSNGTSTLPNLGINVPAATVTLRYVPLSAWDYAINRDVGTTNERPDGRVRVGAYAALALQEHITPLGPKYPVYIGAIYAERLIGRKHRLFSGFGYEWHESFYAFAQHLAEGTPEADPAAALASARNAATRYEWFVGDELRFGRVGILGELGLYLNPVGEGNDVFYERLAWRYYLPTRHRTEPFVGVQLKAQRAVADYFSLGVGVAF